MKKLLAAFVSLSLMLPSVAMAGDRNRDRDSHREYRDNRDHRDHRGYERHNHGRFDENHRHRHDRHDRYRRNSDGVIVGIIGGALLGSLLTRERRSSNIYYNDRYARYDERYCIQEQVVDIYGRRYVRTVCQ